MITFSENISVTIFKSAALPSLSYFPLEVNIMTSKFSQGDHVYLLDVNNPSLPHKRRGIRDYYNNLKD